MCSISPILQIFSWHKVYCITILSTSQTFLIIYIQPHPMTPEYHFLLELCFCNKCWGMLKAKPPSSPHMYEDEHVQDNKKKICKVCLSRSGMPQILVSGSLSTSTYTFGWLFATIWKNRIYWKLCAASWEIEVKYWMLNDIFWIISVASWKIERKILWMLNDKYWKVCIT